MCSNLQWHSNEVHLQHTTIFRQLHHHHHTCQERKNYALQLVNSDEYPMESLALNYNHQTCRQGRHLHGVIGTPAQGLQRTGFCTFPRKNLIVLFSCSVKSIVVGSGDSKCTPAPVQQCPQHIQFCLSVHLLSAALEASPPP